MRYNFQAIYYRGPKRTSKDAQGGLFDRAKGNCTLTCDGTYLEWCHPDKSSRREAYRHRYAKDWPPPSINVPSEELHMREDRPERGQPDLSQTRHADDMSAAPPTDFFPGSPIGIMRHGLSTL